MLLAAVATGAVALEARAETRPATETPREYADACEGNGGGVLDVYSADGDLISSTCLDGDGEPMGQECNWETSTCSDPSAPAPTATVTGDGPTPHRAVTESGPPRRVSQQPLVLATPEPRAGADRAS